MRGKRGFEFSFAWLFSIIIGAVILFLAIYAAVSLVKSERTVRDTLDARQLEILLQPLETQSAETAVRPKAIHFPGETRLSISCSDEGSFGFSEVKVATKSKAGKPWQETGVSSNLHNKYLFSSAQLEGRDIHLFTVPFNMPFKITDLVFLWNKEECFVNPSNDIRDTFVALNLNESNVRIAGDISECSPESVKVCFGGGGGGYSEQCEIKVDLTNKIVQKEGRLLPYQGELIYGAIFSDPSNYDCLVKRILQRTEELAELYKSKSEFLETRSTYGCGSSLQADLGYYQTITQARAGEDSLQVFSRLTQAYAYAEELDRKQSSLVCSLWKEEFR